MANAPTNQNLDTRFVYQIGQDYFWIEVWLYNFLDNFPPLQVPFFFINQISIEENLNDWNVKGYIVLENDYEILERGAPAYIGNANGAADTGGYKAPYLFRTDGRNRLSIKIYPFKNQQNDISETLPLPEWQMNYNFIIYDVQDMSPNEPGKKLRAYYFKDEKHQIFQERNIEWSTSGSVPVGAKDDERLMFGTEAIKSVISTAARVNGKPIKVGYTSKGSISKPDIELDNIDTNDWAADPADTSAKIFYTSPGTHNVLQDLNYLINLTKSSDNSPVLLQYGRNEYNIGWKLIPLSKFFKNSQKNQIERLVINDGSDATNLPPSIPRADVSVSSAIRNFTSGTASMIMNYHYSPMVAIDDNLLCNSPLYNYDFRAGKYNIHFQKNSISNLLNSTSKMVQNGLFNFSEINSNGQLQLNINPTKSSGIMTKNYFSPQQFYLKDQSLINMMKDLVFLAGSVFFQAPGLTIRTPGKFIYIDKLGAGNKNGFDDRFLGQWMITKITHFFTKGSYVNDVVATKIDSYSKIYPESKTDKSY